MSNYCCTFSPRYAFLDETLKCTSVECVRVCGVLGHVCYVSVCVCVYVCVSVCVCVQVCADVWGIYISI